MSVRTLTPRSPTRTAPGLAQHCPSVAGRLSAPARLPRRQLPIVLSSENAWTVAPNPVAVARITRTIWPTTTDDSGLRLLGTRPTAGRPRVGARQDRIAELTLSEGGVGPPQTTESRVHTPGRRRGIPTDATGGDARRDTPPTPRECSRKGDHALWKGTRTPRTGSVLGRRTHALLVAAVERSTEKTRGVMGDGCATRGRERQVTPAGMMAGSAPPLEAHHSLQTPRVRPLRSRGLPARANGMGRVETHPAEGRRRLVLTLSLL